MTGQHGRRSAGHVSGSFAAIVTNVGWLLGGKGVGALLSLVYLAVVTRTLGLSAFGQFTLVIGTAQTITAVVGFQTWQIIVRYGVAPLHEGRTDALARLIKACLLLDLGGALLGGIISVVAVSLFAPYFGWSDELARQALLFCIVTLVAVRSTSVGILRLYDRFGVAAMMDTVMPVARLAGALIVWATVGSVEGFLLAWILAELMSGAAYWIGALVAARGLPWRGSRLSWKKVLAENPGIVFLAGTTNASSTFALTSRQVAVLLVGFFVTPAAAGGFRLAHQLGNAFAKLSQLFSRALFPELMRARALSVDPDHFARLLGRSVRMAAVCGGVIFVLLLTVGEPLLRLIGGDEFSSAYPLLLLLGTAAVFDMMGVAFEPALIALGRAGTSFRIQLATAVLLVASMVVLLSLYGTIGAAVAVLGGSALGFAMMAWATARAVRRRDPVVKEVDAVIIEGRSADIDRPETLG
jgi:O-antigen/teichoic acid export membrane protein